MHASPRKETRSQAGDDRRRATEEAEALIEGRRLTFMGRGLWLAALLCALFVPVDLFLTGYLHLALVEGLAAGLLALSAWLLHHQRFSSVGRWLGPLVVATVILVAIATGQVTDAVVTWAILFPMVPSFLLGPRHGLLVVLTFGVGVLLAMGLSSLQGGVGTYSPTALLNVIGALAGGSAFAVLYERASAESARLLSIAANTDPLTGIPNRRAFVAGFHGRFHAARRDLRPLSLLVFDLDWLKRINDRHGHGAGDAALRHLAKVVGKRVRGQDLLARIGGDEFALLLPGTDQAGAITLAEQLRTALREAPLDIAGTELVLTLSLGAATLPAPLLRDLADPEQALDTLFALADDRLYTAKERGRDGVVGA